MYESASIYFVATVSIVTVSIIVLGASSLAIISHYYVAKFERVTKKFDDLKELGKKAELFLKLMDEGKIQAHVECAGCTDDEIKDLFSNHEGIFNENSGV